MSQPAAIPGGRGGRARVARALRQPRAWPCPTGHIAVIAPLALIGLISLPIIVAYYMLRLRRRDVPVGSTFLWQQLVRDVEANAPWQRLRFSWLLLLQLLIALVAVIAAARPFLTVSSDLAANVVLIVDTSASMGTRRGRHPAHGAGAGGRASRHRPAARGRPRDGGGGR